MAQNITIWGASYSNVPGVDLPKTGGGTARFTDTSASTCSASNMTSGTIGYDSNGELVTGSLVVKHYYYGTNDPVAANLNDGDIYLKVVT